MSQPNSTLSLVTMLQHISDLLITNSESWNHKKLDLKNRLLHTHPFGAEEATFIHIPLGLRKRLFYFRTVVGGSGSDDPGN